MSSNARHYSDDGFWSTLKRHAIKAGRKLVETALQLYYAARRPETPTWAKAVIYGALGYFILPIDAIPDPTPIVGFSDDLGVLAAALATVAAFIDAEVREKAEAKLQEWFG